MRGSTPHKLNWRSKLWFVVAVPLTLSKLKKEICALRYVVTGIPVFIYAIAGYSKSSHRGTFGDRDRDNAPVVVCRLSPFL